MSHSRTSADVSNKKAMPCVHRDGTVHTMGIKRLRPLLFLLLLVAAHRMHDMYIGLQQDQGQAIVEQVDETAKQGPDPEEEAR